MTKPNTTPAASASRHTPERIHLGTRHDAPSDSMIFLCSSEFAGWEYRLSPCGRVDGKEPNAKREANGPHFDSFAREIIKRYNALAGMNPEAVPVLINLAKAAAQCLPVAAAVCASNGQECTAHGLKELAEEFSAALNALKGSK